MNKIFEEHVVKLEINIKQLHFQITLPARVTFSVQVDGKTISESRKVYSLEGESCLPFEKHSCELLADFDAKKNTYLFKEIALVTHYQGSKGIEGSRVVKFDPFLKNSQEKEWILPNESTPDFKIFFVSSIMVVSKKIKSSRVTSNAHDQYKYTSAKKQGHIDRRASAINELIRNDGEGGKRQSQVNGYQRQNFADKTKRLENFKSVPIDAKKRNAKNRIPSPKYAEESDQTTKAHDELQNLRRKIELERQEKVRSITKLKMEVSPNFLGLENKNQESQSAKLKQKIRNYERKQKNFIINIDELNNELEKRKAKIAQLQKKKDQLEKIVNDRDIKLKAAQGTIRTLNQQLQSLTSKERVVSKKGEAKEAAFKDQMRKLEEKLRLQELQIAKLNEEKGSNIKGLEFCEKLHQNALKEKDIKMNEQKSKFYKIKQQFTQREVTLNLTIEQLSVKLDNFQHERNQTEERIQSLHANIFNYENEIAAFKQSIKLEREESERKLQEHLSKLNNDINNARTKYNDLTSECNLLKDKLKKLQASKDENEARIKQLEEALKVKTNESNKNIVRINSLKQQLQTSNEENLRKSREIDGLRQTIATFKQKLTQMKDKADEEKRGRLQANNVLQRQINDFGKQRQSFQAEINDLKWSIVRNNDTISQLQYQIKQQNGNLLKLNEETMSKTQKHSSLEERLRDVQQQRDNIEKQKINFANRIKELNQIVKMRTLEFDEEKKLRIKAQQRAEEEKEKNRQYLLFSKEKELQQEERLKQKEALIARKQQEINALEIQITKKKEQINALKNSNQSILREIQLSKMDNDTIKSQLNILESTFKSLKQENITLLKSIETLNNNLSAHEQSSAMQLKKCQLLQREYDQYKENTERAIENLFSELFKEQTGNSNVIAATLLPFPTQKLSLLQVELVQKRNNFIIKYRQKVSDLENQVDSLEHQIQQLKQLYQNREEMQKRYDAEEREKLKGLLYENMMEKNGLGEELVVQRKEKEQVEKQIQKLKGQIFKKEDIQQELNGQLQLLLLQYDGMKSQNQDLNGIIFKYKELEIKNKSEFEQRLSLLQQETSSQIDKLKVQGLQRQRKIIQLEKQLLDLNEKTRKNEQQKLKAHGLLELSKESVRILQQKISYSNLQITKLNNGIKNMEKKQGNYRDTIDKLEGQLAQQTNKCQILQNSLLRLTSEHFQINVQREKLAGQLANSKERSSQLEKLLYEKGEVNKEKIEKKMEENSVLKSNLIQKTSDIELKDFYLKQKQQQCQGLIEENQDSKKTIIALKARVKELINSLEESQSKSKELNRQLELLIKQRQKKEEILGQSNFIILSLQNELQEMSNLNKVIQIKQRECIQLRETRSQSQEYYLNQLKKTKEVISQLKNELKNERNHIYSIQQQYKTNIQTISKSNNQRYKYLENEFMQEKDDFNKRVEEIQTHNKRVIAEFQSRIEKLKEDLYESKENEKAIADQGYKKQNIFRNLSKRNEQLQNELDQFKQKYNRYYNLYQENKAELGQNLKQNQSKLINTMEKSKISQLKQYSIKIKQMQRKLQRYKHSEELEVKTQTISRRDLKNILEKIFNKLSEIIRDSEITSEELWQGSRVDPIYS